MLKIKDFTKEIRRVETIYDLYCIVIIDGKEHEVSAMVTEDDYYTKFDFNSGVENIDDELLENLEIEMLHNLENN
jgi:hypothetical protein